MAEGDKKLNVDWYDPSACYSVHKWLIEHTFLRTRNSLKIKYKLKRTKNYKNKLIKSASFLYETSHLIFRVFQRACSSFLNYFIDTDLSVRLKKSYLIKGVSFCALQQLSCNQAFKALRMHFIISTCWSLSESGSERSLSGFETVDGHSCEEEEEDEGSVMQSSPSSSPASSMLQEDHHGDGDETRPNGITKHRSAVQSAPTVL